MVFNSTRLENVTQNQLKPWKTRCMGIKWNNPLHYGMLLKTDRQAGELWESVKFGGKLSSTQ